MQATLPQRSDPGCVSAHVTIIHLVHSVAHMDSIDPVRAGMASASMTIYTPNPRDIASLVCYDSRECNQGF